MSTIRKLPSKHRKTDIASKNLRKATKHFFIFLILTNLYTTKRKIVVNQDFALPNTFHWANSKGEIVDGRVFFKKANWVIECDQINAHSHEEEKTELYDLTNLYQVNMVYQLPPNTPSRYLVFQDNLRNQEITNRDRCAYMSNHHRLKVELYDGKLYDPKNLLCGKQGLENIADGINKYNKSVEKFPEFKIKKLNQSINLFKFEEKSLTILDSFHLIYSNEIVLHDLKINPDNFQIKRIPDGFTFYKDSYINWLHNLKNFFLKVIKTVGTISGNKEKKDEINQMFEPFSQKLVSKLDDIENQINQGVHNPDFKQFENNMIIFMTEIFKENLKLKRNLIFTILLYDFNYGGNGKLMAMKIDEMAMRYMGNLSFIRPFQYEAREDFYLTSNFGKLMASLPDFLANLFNNFLDKLKSQNVLEETEHTKFEYKVKSMCKRISNYMNSHGSLYYSFPTYVKDQIRDFIVNYANEPHQFALLNHLKIMDEHSHIIAFKFFQILNYFGLSPAKTYFIDPFEVKIFKAVDVVKKKKKDEMILI